MKIIHPSGKAYHLSPDTQLEIERPNLFFNDYGEQSLPVDLPDSEHNRALMGYPDQLANRKKPSADIVCTLQDGDYSVQARQAILGAKRNEHISTSFYLNDGAFLSKLNDVSLKKVFGDECIPGVNTVEEGLAFCRSLMNNESDEYAIFPLLVDEGDTDDDGNAMYKCLNFYGYKGDTDYSFREGVTAGLDSDFYHARPRTKQVGEETVSVGVGYYITPFIRANYLLKRILMHFGYTLLDNFFTDTEPFNKMVVLNTTCDSLINGCIRIKDLLPDCSCADILEVYRKSFFCEFIADEVGKTIKIVLFKDCCSAPASIDLSPYAVGEPEISYPEKYKQICVKYQDKLSDACAVEGESTLADLVKKYSYVYQDAYGAFCRVGYQYRYHIFEGGYISEVAGIVSPASMPYQADGEMEVESVEIPAMLPEFRTTRWLPSNSNATLHHLLGGEARWLNSVLVATSTSNEESDAEVAKEVTDENTQLPIMFSFVYRPHGLTKPYALGTITNYLKDITYDDYLISGYTLCPSGPDGLYEMFYRDYDNLLRNSLHAVTMPLLLPTEVKRNLESCYPVVIDNQKMFVNMLRYSLGGDVEPMESEFLTLRLYEPINRAKDLFEMVADNPYKWKGCYHYEEATASAYSDSEEKYSHLGYDLDPIFPIEPRAEYVGKRYYERIVYFKHDSGGQTKYYKHTFWLECELKATT